MNEADILVFSKTYTGRNEPIKVPGYTVFYRSDSHFKGKGPRGVICFAKKNNIVEDVTTIGS